MHEGYLPASRFTAYEQLVELLTVRHPALRRKAAGMVSESVNPLNDAERNSTVTVN